MIFCRQTCRAIADTTIPAFFHGRCTAIPQQRFIQLTTLRDVKKTQKNLIDYQNNRRTYNVNVHDIKKNDNHTTAPEHNTTGHESHGNKQWFKIAKPGKEKGVAYWLLGSAAITAGVMAMGAYVRLNESGLSMLDWRLVGKQLPKDEQEWIQEFERYKTTPEYLKVHYDIDLEEYKNIYINEWAHRMLGRLSGICFGGGALYLALRRALAPGGYILAIGVAALGLSQAFVGKWMVDSGFKEPETENKTPRVSPYRLTIHFTNALAIYSLCLWNGIKLIKRDGNIVTPQTVAMRAVRNRARMSLLSTFLTMIYGTLVAGNDAGLAYNTWPKMLDTYIPDDYAHVDSLKHLFEKTGVVQFNHRCLGYITILATALTYCKTRAQGVPRPIRKLAMGALHASIIQVIIGIITVIKHVPLHGAMAHHTNAMALWSVLLMLLSRIK
ncbi:Cytochrome c oxidase assembly protein COX15 [Babesia sp. Xinjiang]|uniref:Cytochrome c oxidase assembly protein COX15 n=1 Tax=Babesia sp. Xinjiang TaxID=462227 RepID=UPI000A23638D|nr:Cytochrome c oxidase assembly protein COX15 [Babesia sp. Xinjiang]ORM41178.1 Cytochrome c oxidase assembly protein COX15 [Babesia sp. Xinjiang]